MKLKFERFEGLACFSVRGEIEVSQQKLLLVGLETLCKTLEEELIINLMLAKISEPTVVFLQNVKKIMPKLTKKKVHWLTPIKGLGDAPNMPMLTARLSGFKSRQIGERIQLEDDVYVLNTRIAAVEAKIQELGGNQDRAQKIIIENGILKEQERILKTSNHAQDERMKLQTVLPLEDEETPEKTKAALQTFKTYSGLDVKL